MMRLTISDVRAENYDNLKFALRTVADRFFGDETYSFGEVQVAMDGNTFVAETSAYEVKNVTLGRGVPPREDLEWDPFANTHPAYPF
jgi:hypothetical protein